MFIMITVRAAPDNILARSDLPNQGDHVVIKVGVVEVQEASGDHAMHLVSVPVGDAEEGRRGRRNGRR